MATSPIFKQGEGQIEHPLSLVFVPGSWHQPTCYDKVIKIIAQKHGVECTAFTLPSTVGDPAATFKNDIDAARAAILRATNKGHDVIVIAHSYGGMVGNSAIKDLTIKDAPNSLTPSTGHVVGLILIASGFTLTGLAFMDPFFGHPPPSWRVNSSTGFAELVAPPSKLFYHDLSAEEAAHWVSELRPQALKALFEGGEHAYAGWQDVPTWYVGTSEDKAMPVFAQRVQIGMARVIGGVVEHREMPTSHSPFLSRPEDVVEIIMDVVDARKRGHVRSGSIVGQSAVRIQRTSEVVTPSVKLWQPYSWFKFGVPYALGRGIGFGILAWAWGRRMYRSWR
ncbi:alpha/beta-hydrolase [Phaeosphaeriaceae sp. SRC1lsM3a]|nr:alpha/beta-hydrolase [Stagonospora sp. SRC1lsM3a]